MDLSVITVTWNAADEILAQMRSVISGCEGISCEQIIIDNGSTDGTADLIRKNFPAAAVIENGSNAGFGVANNQGAATASGDFLLFLNPDMVVSPGSLDTMIDWMRAHPIVGASGCKLVDERGAFNWPAGPRRFPTIGNQIAIIFKLPHLFPPLLKHYLYQDGFDPDREQEVDSVRGSFLLVRRAIVEKLGRAFDPRYFIWFEDVDLCREVWRLGYKVMYVPALTAIDRRGRSFSRRSFPWKQWQFIRSMFKYFVKWGIR